MAMELNIVRNLKLRELGVPTFGLQRVLLPKIENLVNIGPLTRNRECPAYACKARIESDCSVFALAYEDGRVLFQTVSDERAYSSAVPHFTRVHTNAIFDLCWIPGEPMLLTASGDESTTLLNLSGSTPVIQDVFHAHTSSVRRVTSCPGSPHVFATAGRDGDIVFWDTRSHLKQDAIIGAHRAFFAHRTANGNFRSHSVLDLKFINGTHLISCGNADNSIKVWDMRRTHMINRKRPVPTFCLKNPTQNKVFLDITLDPNGRQFYATSSCNRIYLYTHYNEHCDGWFTGATVNSDYVRTCVSPDGEYLASGSLDCHAYIWPARRNKQMIISPVSKLVTHTNAVTAIAWASIGDSPLIVTCSDDSQEILWGLPILPDGEDDPFEKEERESKESRSSGNFQMQQSNFVRTQERTPTKSTLNEEYLSPLSALTPDLCGPSGSRRPILSNDRNGNRSGENHARFLENLPNFVVDGTSPHNLGSPGSANHKENVDWLTKHRKNSASEEKSDSKRSNFKKRPGGAISGGLNKKSKGKSLLQYFPKISKIESDEKTVQSNLL